MPEDRILYMHESAQMGGAENSLLQLALNIERKKFIPFFILGQEGDLARLLRRGNIEVSVISLPRFFHCLGFLSSLFKVIAFARRNQIDIIHTNSVRTHLYGAIAARLLGIFVIWHERCLLTREWVDLDRVFYFFAQRIICNSHAISRRFLRAGKLPDNLRVVFNGVDLKIFSPRQDEALIKEQLGIKAGETVIGIASRFDITKGHETLLKAVGKIISGHLADQANLKLLIVGTGVFKEESGREELLRQMAQELGLKDKVIFTGFRSDMAQVYAAMDIFVLASDAEGFGRVTIEAMALAKPVVGTNSGATPEIVIDKVTGLLFTPGDAAGLADRIAYLLNNPQVARQMGLAGRSIAQEKFSIRQHALEIQKIYDELLAKDKK
jgi:glycosyltransferase involved in cell wall biosynthesis